MSRARWAQAALVAAGLAACAHAHSASSPRSRARGRASMAETGASYLGGQAGQPGSWIARAPSSLLENPSPRVPAGQAAQPYSWIGEEDPVAPAPTRLAQDGPSYLGGQAGQPASWLSETPKSPLARTSSLAAVPGTARQH